MKAFPTPTFSISEEARVTSIGGEGGMELRDYFAAKAMQVCYVTAREMFMDNTFEDWSSEAVIYLAQDAYEIADAMLKARES
jgi:hypothetical protein